MEYRPYTLVAELTYRCPLRCVYCSNPVDLEAHRDILPTTVWLDVLESAQRLGALQVHFTGGEPLLRKDLEAIVERASELGLYSNLITSGVGLTERRLASLARGGLQNVQISFQDLERNAATYIAGVDCLDQKLAAARRIRASGLALTVNVVLHRLNIDRVEQLIAFAEEVGADRLELANAQYQGWAFENRDLLLPNLSQLETAAAIARNAKARLEGKMELLFVLPDYYVQQPRACMDGWGRRFIVVSPAGLVLPCHAAHSIVGLQFESVRERSLDHLGRFAGSRRLSRRSLDAGALPQLSTPRNRFRGMQMPSVSAYGKCWRYRPRLQSRPCAFAHKVGSQNQARGITAVSGHALTAIPRVERRVPRSRDDAASRERPGPWGHHPP